MNGKELRRLDVEQAIATLIFEPLNGSGPREMPVPRAAAFS